MHRLARKAFDNQKSIGRIETAIMPFAFVVVDEVFTCVALTAGLSSTQKAKATTHFKLD